MQIGATNDDEDDDQKDKVDSPEEKESLMEEDVRHDTNRVRMESERDVVCGGGADQRCGVRQPSATQQEAGKTAMVLFPGVRCGIGRR